MHTLFNLSSQCLTYASIDHKQWTSFGSSIRLAAKVVDACDKGCETVIEGVSTYVCTMMSPEYIKLGGEVRNE